MGSDIRRSDGTLLFTVKSVTYFVGMLCFFEFIFLLRFFTFRFLYTAVDYLDE